MGDGGAFRLRAGRTSKVPLVIDGYHYSCESEDGNVYGNHFDAVVQGALRVEHISQEDPKPKENPKKDPKEDPKPKEVEISGLAKELFVDGEDSLPSEAYDIVVYVVLFYFIYVYLFDLCVFILFVLFMLFIYFYFIF